MKSIDVLYQINPNSKLLSSEKPCETDQNRRLTFKLDIQPDKEIVDSLVERTEY